MLRLINYSWKIITIFEKQSLVKSRTVPSLGTLCFIINHSQKLPSEIQNVARRKLRMINNAQDINDLRIPPAIRLEKLKGDMSKYHSIRINNQWRIIFN